MFERVLLTNLSRLDHLVYQCVQNIFNQFCEVKPRQVNKSSKKRLNASPKVPLQLEKLEMQTRHVSSIHCLSHRLR